MWNELAIALCLVLIIEGIMPFVAPARWKRMIVTVASADDRSIRLVALVCMLAGTALLYVVR